MIVVEHGNAVDLVQRVWTDFTVRRVRRRSIGMTEEANVSGNALDMPTSVWSKMARQYAEPIHSEKANDDRRQSVDASQYRCPRSSSAFRQHSSIAKWHRVKPRLLHCAAGRLASLIGGGLMRA